MSNEKRVQQAVEAFMNGKSCSQAVFCVYGPALGIPEEAALTHFQRLWRRHGKFVRGLRCSDWRFYGDPGPKACRRKKRTLWCKLLPKDFETRYGSLHCTRLLGFDLSTENGREGRKKSGIGHEHCAQYVQGSAEILERLLFADATK